MAGMDTGMDKTGMDKRMIELGIGAFTPEMNGKLGEVFKEHSVPKAATIRVEDRKPETPDQVLAKVFEVTIRYKDIDPDVLDMLGWN